MPLDLSKIVEASKVAEGLLEQASFYRLGGYDPYPFQVDYHRCRDGRGERAFQYLLSSGNQCGKTEGGGADVAIHATGDYPDFWDFDEYPDLTPILRKYPEIWVGGENNDRVRDIAQSQLCGKAGDPGAWGTGWLPKESLIGKVRKTGVSEAFESVTVRHKQGFVVTIKFKAYAASLLDWAGTPVALIWLDEEPPRPYYTQCLARTIATGGFVKMSFTPEKGATELVSEFSTSSKPGQGFNTAGWKDARHSDGRTHLTESVMAQLLEAFPPHERKMRSEGIPVLGAGMVFPVAQDKFMIDPILLPKHCFHVVGMDFGSGGVNHPTAAAWWAFDRDAKMAYLYDTYKSLDTELAVHAVAVRARGPWIPVAWPHDGQRTEAYATEGVANAYRNAGVNMRSTHFLDPDTDTIGVEAGVQAMYQGMTSTGKWILRVFSTCHDFLKEFPLYHRKETPDKGNTIVRSNDDVMSAARIGFRSERYARQEEFHLHTPAAGVAQGTNDQNVFSW